MKKCFLFFLLISIKTFSQIPPPNSPAEVIVKDDSVKISYQGKIIFKGFVQAANEHFLFNNKREEIAGKVYQTIVFSLKSGKKFNISAEISGSNQSFPCESEAKDGLKIVRHSVGLSHSLRNDAVYDRQNDWLFSIDENNAKVSIQPAQITEQENHFEVKVNSWEITFRFFPHYYQKHRGLAFFEPWNYQIWSKPVVGWCSWFAYFDTIDEGKIRRTADIIAEKFKPFGLEYLQIDDGYQQTPIGMPNTWLKPNQKFPNGLQNLANYIHNKGLKPAIWTNVSFADSAAVVAHSNLFVKNPKGLMANGNWIGYVIDGSNPETIRQVVSPVYDGFKQMGWQYYKLDALRHLRYEGYNSFVDYFTNKKYDRVEAFRNVVKSVRASIGKDNFLLGCWGARPELTGIIDGCRIGNDGYSYAGLAQFNSYNNIVWLNDPDHIVLSEKEAYRSCVATSLTGSLFMITDKPEKYETSLLIEAARRSIPVLPTKPGQVYDIDPSRSSKLEMADVEMSGSGPRPFDASSTTTTGLFALELNKPYENWLVLGRLDERDKVFPFKELGLDEKKEFLVFEFWEKDFKGIFTKKFEPAAINPTYNCQVFCFREKLNRPQLLATDRHISCGGFDVKQLIWSNNRLIGTSEIIANDNYTVYLYEPSEFTMKSFECKGANLVSNVKNGMIRQITMRSEAGKNINWQVNY